MAHLAEVYFHLSPYEVAEDAVQRFGREVADIAANAALRFRRPDCIIEVDLESGSLRSRARVIVVGLFTTYGAIAAYPGFKEGVVEITHDAQRFGEAVIEEFLGANNVPPNSVYRTERRTKTPGRLLRIMNRREWLNAYRDLLTEEQAETENAAIQRLTERALEDLAPDERLVVRALLEEGAQTISDKEPEAPVAQEERVAVAERRPQPLLFDFGPSPHDAKDQFHTRFRLSDWQKDQDRATDGHFTTEGQRKGPRRTPPTED